ncbi:hypothetical protein BJ912DRAFT_934953 [Pholiota molesta]|nr:hypothetical protein BJ912DRAFT_934953 [Pholiota molesta]
MEDSSFNGSFTPSDNPSNPSHSLSHTFSNNTALQNIGCTIVVHQPYQPTVWENYFHMPISTMLLAKRSGTYSLYLDSLIIAIRAQILCSPVGTGNPLIDALIHDQPLNGLVSGTNTVTIATCRIPDFSNIPNPSLGYTQLPGSLNHLSLYIPDSSHFMEHGRELLSIGNILQENLHVKEFFNIWQPSGMQLNFHFILLFLLRPVRLATPPNFNTFLSPSSLPTFQSNSSNTEAVIALAVPIPTNSVTNTPGYNSSIAALDFSHILTSTEIIDSQYEAKRKGIVAQVRNWRAMKSALATLSIVSDEDSHIVLENFGWRVTTFKHKSLWYEWGFEAARKTWRRGTYTPVNQDEYRQWRGIVYLFKPNGAIDRNYIPKGTSVDLDERWAAGVTQAKMDSMRTTISAHLV